MYPFHEFVGHSQLLLITYIYYNKIFFRNVKNIMTFAHLSHSKDSASIDEQLGKDPAYKLSLDSDKSNILGRAYHRHTRPRLPWVSVFVTANHWILKPQN